VGDRPVLSDGWVVKRVAIEDPRCSPCGFSLVGDARLDIEGAN
jgi:hypothetical protein